MSKKILVIDDEDAIRKSFILALSDTSYKVITAVSGYKGIEYLKNDTCDLIFLDLKMPGLSGVSTLMELRKLNRTIPIYIITAFYEEYFGELRDARKKGMEFELMKKPIGSDEIVVVTRSILECPENV